MSEPCAVEEAVLGILALVAAADEVVEDREAAWWLGVRRRHPLFAGLPHEEVEAMLRRVRARLDAAPPGQALAAWAVRVPAAQAERVYALALELQFIDRTSHGAESETTQALARALGLAADRAAALYAAAARSAGG